jgi:hypothetical protein
MVALVVTIGLCGALSAAILTTNGGRQREARMELARERAFHLAEAGVDWAIAQIRFRHGIVPEGTFTQTLPKAGKYVLRYAQGDQNHVDDDGDGVVDDAGEHGYVTVTSTGECDGVRRTLEIVLRKAVEIPSFNGTAQMNVEAPVVDLAGNAFTVQGVEHALDGTVDLTIPAKYAIASPAQIADVLSQIPVKNYDQFTGLGGQPSIGVVAPIDLDKMMDQAMNSANVLIEPGTHTSLALGNPTESGVTVSYCCGDLHLSGSNLGAGVLAVDGDLTISGAFTWTGIIMVRGRVNFVGGGSTKRVIGVVAVDEEVGNQSSTTTISLAGTVDLLYSGQAISLAAESLSIMAVMSWREVANP